MASLRGGTGLRVIHTRGAAIRTMRAAFGAGAAVQAMALGYARTHEGSCLFLLSKLNFQH